MILPSNNSPYPLFVTKLKKQLFKTNQISLGHGIHGDEIWVAIKNKKQIERSDKLISGEWLKVSFGISERGRFSVKDKYVYKKDLIEAGISENTILKYKNKLSILLAAHQCFYECEEAIRDSRIYCPDVATFADLLKIRVHRCVSLEQK